MAILRETIEVIVIPDEVEGDGKVLLREPSTEEWNAYSRDRFELKRKNRELINHDISAKIELFNKICVEVVNIVDYEGKPIARHDLPARLKAEAIFKAFEDKIADSENEKN